VFFSIPITFMPDSLNRIANLVKSESLETIQTHLLYQSIASPWRQ
jgi:hypothetical protein